MLNPSLSALVCLGLLLPAARAQTPPSSNILSSANGAAIVRFTAAQTNIAALIDATKRAKPAVLEGKFPQEIVFAFREDQEALVDRLVLKPDAKTDQANWPKRVSVAVSMKTPLEGFEDVGELSLEQEARDQTLSINKRARYLKLRVIENFGGKQLQLGEVRAYEGTEPDYVSLIKRPSAPRTAKLKDAGAAIPSDTNEPNNTPEQATKITFGQPLRGSINPPGEFDYFSLTVPGTNARVITLNLEAAPYIRTSVALLRDGQVVKQFDPSKAALEHTELSWLVEPGDYLVRLTEPPISMVLIWDSSNSMKGNEEPLQRGVEAFLSKVKAPDRLQLIQFSSKVEPFTTNYSSDATELQAVFKKRYKLGNGTAFF